jgi:hypothetical protein
MSLGTERIVGKQEVIRSLKSPLDEVPEERGYICLPDPPNGEHTENQDFFEMFTSERPPYNRLRVI